MVPYKNISSKELPKFFENISFYRIKKIRVESVNNYNFFEKFKFKNKFKL